MPCHDPFGLKTPTKFNSLASAWFRGFSEKKHLNAVALRGNFSSPVCSTDLVKVSKDVASLLVCTRKKNFFLEGCGFFVSDVTSGGLLGHLGPLCLALGANH